MYKVMLMVNGAWEDWGNSNSFSDAWAYGRSLRAQGPVKIVGPEGEDLLK